MLALIFIIPIIFVIFLIIFFRDKVTWWEYILLIVPSMLISTAIYFGMISYSQSDIEYLGDYVTEIRDYDEWNEYVHRTCTRTISGPKGVSHTVTYDCSYVDFHPRRLTQVFSNGDEKTININEYYRMFTMWGTPNEFVELNRHYHTIDGDMHKKKWNGMWQFSKTRTIEHVYKNKIKSSHSIFGFTKISENDVKEFGLYDYPKLVKQSETEKLTEDDRNQIPFLGYNPTRSELLRWQYINGFYGTTSQFRCYLLFFYNKPQSIVGKQKDYWEGGNKNEMIMCFGIDSTTKKIQWFDSFSWCDSPAFEVNFRSYMNECNDTLNLISLANWVESTGINYWKRKNFSDFDYVKVELSGTQLTWLFIIILLFNIAMSVYIVLNDQTNEK